MPYFKRPGLAFTEQQRVRNLRIAIERGKVELYLIKSMMYCASINT